MSGEEKACILAWKPENFHIKETRIHIGWAKSAMIMVAAAHDSPLNVYPPVKPYPGCLWKASNTTDKLLPSPVLLNDASIQFIQQHPQKALYLLM